MPWLKLILLIFRQNLRWSIWCSISIPTTTRRFRQRRLWPNQISFSNLRWHFINSFRPVFSNSMGKFQFTNTARASIFMLLFVIWCRAGVPNSNLMVGQKNIWPYPRPIQRVYLLRKEAKSTKFWDKRAKLKAGRMLCMPGVEEA